MTRVTVDNELKQRLYDLTREIELCDEAGRVLARVKPVVDLAEFEPLPLASREELDRLSKSSENRYSTEEVLDYLEKL